MLDIGMYELLVVGLVALLVVGPKELPGLLRTLGKYLGMVRRQANEFRAQFDEVIRDTEFDEIRKEVDAIRHDTSKVVRDVEKSGSVSMHEAGKSSANGAAAHKPNFSEDELTWLKPQEALSPAAKAAAAATASRGVAQSVAQPVGDRMIADAPPQQIKANGAEAPSAPDDAAVVPSPSKPAEKEPVEARP